MWEGELTFGGGNKNLAVEGGGLLLKKTQRYSTQRS